MSSAILLEIQPFFDRFTQLVSDKYDIENDILQNMLTDIVYQGKKDKKDISESEGKCIAIIKSGKRKGEKCGNNALENSRCGRHKSDFQGEDNRVQKKKEPKPVDTKLHLKKDHDLNITYHQDTKLVVKGDKVVGKFIDGKVEKINKQITNDEDVEFVKKNLLSILGINDDSDTESLEDSISSEEIEENSDIDSILQEIKS